MQRVNRDRGKKIKATLRRKIDRKILMKDDKNKSSNLMTKQVIGHSLVVGVPVTRCNLRKKIRTGHKRGL